MFEPSEDQIKFVTLEGKELMKKQMMKMQKLSPSSPLKDRTCDRDQIIPFKHLNKKTYFKTLENIVQNSNNSTYKRFHQVIEERGRKSKAAQAKAKAAREASGAKQMLQQYLELQQTAAEDGKVASTGRQSPAHAGSLRASPKQQREGDHEG